MSDSVSVDRSALGRLEFLGKGGTAVIHRLPEFRLPGAPPVVFKEYNAKTLAYAGPALRPGLVDLVRERQRMTDDERDRWDRLITWTLRVVDDGGNACGILLPLIPAEFFQQLHSRTGEAKVKPREVDMLFGAAADMSRQGLPATDVRQRLGIARQIARVCAVMHGRRLVFGDFSGRNIVYDVNGARPRVMVVDADGARTEGKRGAFGGQAQTPHWEPPEALHAVLQVRAARRRGDQNAVTTWQRQTMVQNRATDVYKLALMMVRIVDHGRQKAVNRKPDAAVKVFHQAWGRAAAEALERGLSDRPADRPTAEELYRTMRRPQAAPAQVPGPRRPTSRPQTPPTSRPQTPARPQSQSGTTPSAQSGTTPSAQPGTTPAVTDGTVVGGFVYRDGRGWVRNKP